jgi:FAD/FMN-containing dehydrogenase
VAQNVQDNLDRLSSIVGSSNFSRDHDTLLKYSRDPSPFPAVLPTAVVTPTSTEKISQILDYCNETKTPVFPFGSGYSFTGLSNRRPGSAIAIDLKKMDRLIEINEGTLTVRAEAGIIVGNLSDKVRERGYYINTVALPYYQDTLGGMISGVVGGGYPLYSSQVGLNNRHIVGLKVVLPTGGVIETNGSGVSKEARPAVFMRETNSADVTGLFIGDGGIFGIKVEANLAMYPLPPFWKSGSFFFEDFADSYIGLIKASSSEEVRCEYLNLLGPELTEIYRSGSGGSGKVVSISYYLHGFTSKDVEYRVAQLEKIFRESRGVQGSETLSKFAEGIRTGQAYSKSSEYSETLIRRTACAFFGSKVSFPEIFSDIYSDLQKRLTSSKTRKIISSYVIHPVMRNCVWANIILNYNAEDEREEVYQLIRETHVLAANLGVTFETHGGFAADLMGTNWPGEFRNFMRGIKSTLDPNNILNPDLWFTQVK